MNGRLPFGIYDTLADELYTKTQMEKKLNDAFSSFGYQPIQPASIEYYDNYTGVLDDNDLKRRFKLTDRDGSLLTLRSDPTLQICRLSSKLASGVNRVSYTLNSFEYFPESSAIRSREFAQSGVELLGETGIDGDVEIVQLSIAALKNAGLSDFILEIGHAGFFEGILSECGLTDTSQLRALINAKDSLGVEIFLQKNNIENKFIEMFSILPSLFGDASVIERARKVCDNEICRNALNRISYIYSACEKLGISQYITIDLGMVQRHDYYGGLLLRASSGRVGVPILNGGRYDKLARSFGKSEAVGFSIGVKRLMEAIYNEYKAPVFADIAYICNDFALEQKYITPLRSNYKVVKFFGSQSELLSYCKQFNIECAAVISQKGIDYVLGGKK